MKRRIQNPLYDRLSQGEVMEDFEQHRLRLYLQGEPEIPLGVFELSYDTSQGVLDTYRSEKNDRVVEGVRVIGAAPEMARVLDEAKDAIEALIDAFGEENKNAYEVQMATQTLRKIVEVVRLINTGSVFEKEDDGD